MKKHLPILQVYQKKANSNSHYDYEHHKKVNRLTVYNFHQNRQEQLYYQLEKQIKEFGDKVPAEVKSELESKLEALKNEIKNDNHEGMKAKMQELEQLAMKMGEAVYAQQQAAGAGAGTPPPPQGDANGPKAGGDDVIDAEVVK